MYRDLVQQRNLQLDSTCPVCGKAAFLKDDGISGSLTICPVCGKFRYDFSANLLFDGAHRAHESDDSYKLSFHLRTVAERGWGKRDSSFFPMYSGSDFGEMLKRPDLPLEEKTVSLLRHLSGITEYPGQVVWFAPSSDYAVLNAKNPMEAQYHIEAVKDQGYVRNEPIGAVLGSQLQMRFGSEEGVALKITPKGWAEIGRAAQTGWQSANAFIAMWFDDTRLPFDEAIQRAVRNSGYDPIRIDRIQHVNKIDDEIIAQIRRAKFLIADFTGQRGGVYFEAGFMLGLGRQVVWLCEKSHLPQVHFDTRQYNTIDYADVGDLEHRLQMRIEAIFGKGPRIGAT